MSGSEQPAAGLPQPVDIDDFDPAGALAHGDQRFRESHQRLLAAFPDVRLDLEWRGNEASNSVVRARIRGTHQGDWRGIPSTGRPIDILGLVTLNVDAQGAVTDLWLTSDWHALATQLRASYEAAKLSNP